METGIIALIVVAVIIAIIIAICVGLHCCRKDDKQSVVARAQTEEQPTSGPPTSGHSSLFTSNTYPSLSGERMEGVPTSNIPSTSTSGPLSGPPPPTTHTLYTPKSTYRPYKTITINTKTGSTSSCPEKNVMEKCRIKLKQFKFIGHHKKFTRLPPGPLIHAFSGVPSKQGSIQKLLVKEIKGDIMMYPADFDLPMAPLAATRRRSEILEQFYHLGQPIMDGDEYRRRRCESLAIPEAIPVEGNHEKNKNVVEGTPFLEIKPHLAKMPAKRDDTIRHFLLNTQYASRMAFRFVCESGRYISIPSHDIVEPSSRCRVVLVANSDMDSEKENVYFEYTQIPERAVDALREFATRPVIGRVKLRLFPCFINLSPNTFYPSTRRRTTVYTSTLTNTGKVACKFSWPDERGDVVVNPQSGYIKPHSSVQFSFSLKRKIASTALVAEMKYNLVQSDKQDKPSHGTLTVRFETDEMKRLIQLSTKALSVCDTAEDPGYFVQNPC